MGVLPKTQLEKPVTSDWRGFGTTSYWWLGGSLSTAASEGGSPLRRDQGVGGKRDEGQPCISLILTPGWLSLNSFICWLHASGHEGATTMTCIPCHASRTTSVKGASSLADCICPGGTIEDSNAKCVECSIGLKYHSSCSDASGMEHWNQLALDCMLYRDSSMAIASEVSHYLKSYHGEEQNAG